MPVQKGSVGAGEQAHQLEAVLQGAPQAIILRDRTGVIQLWNRAAERLFGWTSAEAYGQHDLPAVPARLHDDLQSVVDTALSHESSGYVETVRVHKSGREIDVAMSLSVIRDEHGEVIGRVSIHQDITAKVQAERHTRVLAMAMEHTADGIFITDKSWRIISVNKAFSIITGFQLDDIKHEPPWVLLGDLPGLEALRDARSHIDEVGHWEEQHWVRRKNMEVFPARISVACVRDSTGHVTHYVGVISDLERLHRAEQASNAIVRDVLTGLPRRELFLDRLGEAINRAEHAGGGLFVLSINLDRFSSVNSSLGILGGDNLLREVARKLVQCAGTGNIVARTAGDEFSVVLEDCPRWEQAVQVATAINTALTSEELMVGEMGVYISPSIGIACYPNDGDDAIELFEAAMSASACVKERGGNGIELYTESMNSDLFQASVLSKSITYALERNEFDVHYQPVVEFDTMRVIGLEALLRWRNPTLGTIAPGRFIPFAERNGLIRDIDLWVMDQACRQAKRWFDEGHQACYVSVNVSEVTFFDSAFAADVRRILSRNAIAPSLLIIEVRAAAFFAAGLREREVLAELNTIGVAVLLDRFAADIINLRELGAGPVKYVKLSRELLRSVCNNRASQAHLRSAIAIAANFGLRLIGSGIEKQSEQLFLSEHGCREGQGYFLARPCTAEQISELLASASRADLDRQGH